MAYWILYSASLSNENAPHHRSRQNLCRIDERDGDVVAGKSHGNFRAAPNNCLGAGLDELQGSLGEQGPDLGIQWEICRGPDPGTRGPRPDR